MCVAQVVEWAFSSRRSLCSGEVSETGPKTQQSLSGERPGRDPRQGFYALNEVSVPQPG